MFETQRSVDSRLTLHALERSGTIRLHILASFRNIAIRYHH